MAVRRRRRLVVSLTIVLQLPALALAVAFAGWVGVAAVALAVALTASFFLAFEGPYRIRPRGAAHLYVGLWPFFAWWTACVALIPLSLLIPAAALAGLPAARAFAVAAALAAVAGLQAVRRTPTVVRVSIAFPDLPPALDGYRIAQLSDIHCGDFAPEARVAAWARQATALGADLIAVTGDLIASGESHVEAVARALGELRAPDGVFVCMGNHDYWGGGETLVAALARNGLRVLRNEAHPIARGPATLLVAAVDDTWSGRAELDRALHGGPPGRDAFPVLLAHDPALFPEAARRGARLTLSGHTHGGQLGVPFFAQRWNLARLVYPYSLGHYREPARARRPSGASEEDALFASPERVKTAGKRPSHVNVASLYVNGGVGTSGPPIRFGVPSEITLLTLRRA